MGEVVRPDFPGLNDLSATQDKLGCKVLLIDLARCPPIIKDQGCLLSAYLYYVGFIAQGVSSCFQQEPRLVDMRNAAETGLTLVSFQSRMWL